MPGSRREVGGGGGRWVRRSRLRYEVSFEHGRDMYD